LSGESLGPIVRIGTRGSALALAQARLLVEALAAGGHASEMVIVETEGDRRAPDTAWGEGAFVKSIERALLDGRADIAVHSAKDVPTDEDARLLIGAYLPREDPLDALVVAAGDRPERGTLENLAPGSIVGTDSPRRTGFLRWHRPDLDVRPLHGNVDTRLRRLDAGEADALVLAVAGLRRLGREERIDQRIAADVIPPAAGQGAIALQIRADDGAMVALADTLDDLPTRQAVETERSFLRAAGGGCRAPIGALAEVATERLRLLGGFATPDGRVVVLDELEGAADGGPALAAELAARLADRRAGLLVGPRVLLTRQVDQTRRLANHLAQQGVRGVSVPSIEIVPATGGVLVDRLGELSGYAWVVLTSANGARAVIAAAHSAGHGLDRARWAAVGTETARVLRQAGLIEVWLPRSASGEAIGEELPVSAGEKVLLLRGSLADRRLPTRLRERGAEVDEIEAYRTLEAPPRSGPLLREALAEGKLGAVLFASPSAVRGLLGLADTGQRRELLAVPAICIGPTTAAAAREAGFTILGRSATQAPQELARTTAALLLRDGAGVTA